MRPEPGALWALYRDEGLTLQQVADRTQSSYGRVRRALIDHPDFAALARSRRVEAPHDSRLLQAKPFDAAQAFSMLRQGLGMRTVAAHFGVCHRTLHKRLRNHEGYTSLMSSRVRRRTEEQAAAPV